jgi:hypothetical protein
MDLMKGATSHVTATTTSIAPIDWLMATGGGLMKNDDWQSSKHDRQS